jgi:hypothetical protein
MEDKVPGLHDYTTFCLAINLTLYISYTSLSARASVDKVSSIAA